MEFVNKSSGNAGFFNTVMGENHMLGCVIARPTYAIDNGKLVPTPDEPWPVEGQPVETPCGEFPADMPFLTGGVDLFVVGHAHHPDGGAGPSLRVDIRVGEQFHRAIQIVGDRWWRESNGTLQPSQPVPFESMPLTYERAYGGKADVDGSELSYPANPDGVGFYVTPEQAEGQPLPNLEDVENPITCVEDQPEPVGTAPYPAGGSLKMINAVEQELEDKGNERITQVKPLMFNNAHPKMIIEPAMAPKPGDVFEATHMTPEGPLRFEMPDDQLHVHVQLEDRSYVFPLHVDQIGIMADDRRVFISHRVVFKYRMVRFERRQATLHAGALPEPVPEAYVNCWED